MAPLIAPRRFCRGILDGLTGYFPYVLTKMLLGDTATEDYQSLAESFFGERDIEPVR
jgi:hypothetical protein